MDKEFDIKNEANKVIDNTTRKIQENLQEHATFVLDDIELKKAINEKEQDSITHDQNDKEHVYSEQDYPSR